MAYCLILVDAASMPDTSLFADLGQGLVAFANAVLSNRDMSRFVSVALAYSGDIRSQEVEFGDVRQLMPALPDETTCALLGVEDIEAACWQLSRASGHARGRGCPAPSRFLLVLGKDKIECPIPAGCTCLWAADIHEGAGKPSRALLSMAGTMLHKMERRIP